MTASPNPIERSFEIAAARCEDLTPLVRTKGSELLKGSMLALTIEAILDFAGERTGHFRLIESELCSHDASARSAKVEAGFASDRPLVF